ncbi:MAG: hypothetical protein U0894_04415 [Pirellulales bacterium]
MPKFGMFKRILAKRIGGAVCRLGLTGTERALAKLVLRGNVESTFGFNEAVRKVHHSQAIA